MLHFTDQMGRAVVLDQYPQRIISLVPSQTELLYDLGLEDRVVGITKFCVHPDSWYRSKTRVGGTKSYHFDRIKALDPDLIIGNKEENEQEQIQELMKHFPVWMSDIFDLPDAYEMMRQVGEIVDREEEAVALVQQTTAGFAELANTRRLSVVYLIWNDPIMAVGAETFIHCMLEQCGWANSLAQFSRYPQLTLAELQGVQPDLLLLSSEPFPFKDQHVSFFQKHLAGTQVRRVDGEAFSWYGSRLLKTQSYLQKLIESVNQDLNLV